MEMALYYPGLGYYTRETAKIGRAGDFYTSPHLHPIFGAMMGRQMEEMWTALGHPHVFRVVEMGAGTGYLAKDMLEYLKGRELSRHLQYTIVELNPSMKAAQELMLKDHGEIMNWCSDLDELEMVSGCFLSNELLDAFPVRMVEMEDELQEIYVSAHDNEFEELRMPCSRDVLEYIKEFEIELPKGYRSEMNLRIRDWIRKVGEKLKDGFVLTVDYGYPAWDYYGEERSRGTLLCYYQHQVNEDPYQNIGEQDLTAHVNFSSLKKWGEDYGLETIGFCGQGAYLISLGIDEVIAELYGGIPDVFETAKIKGLILPQGMGDSHKVMVQHRGPGEPRLRGFALRDHSERL
jgi:SAM-dependent MidA family methyltransferase